MKGKFILVFGPSGSGKGELIAHIHERFPDIIFARSETSRAMRPGEHADGLYHFITREEFDSKIDSGAFLEWAEFGGNRYGTLKSEVLPHLEVGKTVLKEMEVQGVRATRAIVPRESLAIIFIYAGEWEKLEQRILKRAPIREDELLKRKARYEDELSFRSEADYEVENREGGLGDAKKQIEALVRDIVGQ